MNCTYNVFLVEKSFQLTFTSTEPQHINTISIASLLKTKPHCQSELLHTLPCLHRAPNRAVGCSTSLHGLGDKKNELTLPN